MKELSDHYNYVFLFDNWEKLQDSRSLNLEELIDNSKFVFTYNQKSNQA